MDRGEKKDFRIHDNYKTRKRGVRKSLVDKIKWKKKRDSCQPKLCALAGQERRWGRKFYRWVKPKRKRGTERIEPGNDVAGS